MNARHLLAAGMVFCVVTASAWADDKKDKPDSAKLLVGKWEVTKTNKELEVGVVLEFSKEGKMKIIVKDGGKELSRDLVYKVEGDKIHFTRKEGDKEETKNFTIKKISEQELILEAGKGVVIELKRVK